MKYAIITGASRGIGLGTAKLFQEKGYTVINIARSSCPLPGIINWPTDLSDPTTLEHLPARIAEKIKGKSTICLVHNAMRLLRDTISTLDITDLRALMEIGIFSPAKLNQLFLPHMEEGSSIIYVGSTLSEKGIPGAASYIIEKHAVTGLMRSTCQDLAGTGIHTACICPGFTDTAMLQDHLDLHTIAQIADRVAARRLLTPEELARLIHFCAENPLINGSMIHAHLGQLES